MYFIKEEPEEGHRLLAVHEGDGAAPPLLLEARDQTQAASVEELLLDDRLESRDDDEDPEELAQAAHGSSPPT